MKTNINKQIGWLLILGAVAVIIPYSILTGIFNYPDILREDAGTILTQFHLGGNRLIWTWFAFAVTGIPLIPAYILIGQKLENQYSFVRTATTIGVIGLIVQLIGLLRWTFVIPVLADNYTNAADIQTKVAAVMAFKTVHQFGGVLLGEHLGQLFTVIWTILVSVAFAKSRLFPKWVNILGIAGALIYLIAQLELLSTVMPGIMVWEMAGFLGSTLWLIWLIINGVLFINTDFKFFKQ